ncbi:MAG: hypothetical protein AAGK01_04335, partial [Pseudomonadota bacterium]
LGILAVEQVNFANGSRALLWSNNAEPGRVTVRVRFGAGYRAFDASSAVYAPIGEMALVGSGLGDLGQNEIDRLAMAANWASSLRSMTGCSLSQRKPAPMMWQTSFICSPPNWACRVGIPIL